MKTNGNDLLNEGKTYCGPDTIACGLTKREYFAILILQGLTSNSYEETQLQLINRAINCADLFIETLNKKDK